MGDMNERCKHDDFAAYCHECLSELRIENESQAQRIAQLEAERDEFRLMLRKARIELENLVGMGNAKEAVDAIIAAMKEKL